MKKHSMPDMKEGGVNVTPLIDVVMCLIIFFMLVAKIGVSSGIDNKIDAPTTYLGVKMVHPLQEVLKDMKKERGDAFKVIINAEKSMRYAQVQLVLQECAVAGV